MTMVSGRTIKVKPLPNIFGSSAVAPTAAAPICACAMPVPMPAAPIAMPAPTSAIPTAVGSSAILFYLLFRHHRVLPLVGHGREIRSPALEELEEELDVVQSDSLNA